MDTVVYALAKKMVASVASGITEVQTDGTNIRFKTADGEWFTVRLNREYRKWLGYSVVL